MPSKRTPTRHAELRFVDWIETKPPGTNQEGTRVVVTYDDATPFRKMVGRELLRAGMFAGPDISVIVGLSKEGRALLSEWDDQYPEGWP